MRFDVFLNENKGFKYCFKPLCCKCTQKVVNMWLLLGIWGHRSSPIQTVQGLWHLTTYFSQLYSLYSKEKKKDRDIAPKWWVKSMIKHFYRHKRQTVVFSHVKNETARCWNTYNTNTHLISGCLKDEALKNKTRVKPWPVLIWISFFSLSCFCRLSTISKLALVN